VPKGSRRHFAAYGPNVMVAAPDPGRRQLAHGKLAHLNPSMMAQE